MTHGEHRSRPAARLTAEHRRHRAEHLVTLVAELDEPEAWRELLEWIERKPFFADQVQVLGSFERSSADLEDHMLPALARSADWPRFLRYATLATNLRGFAEAVADEEILRSLVRVGRASLAEAVAFQLPDGERRAVAGAAVASALGRKGSAFAALVRRVEGELSALPPPPDPSAAGIRAAALASVGRSLAPELAAHWQGWIGVLARWPERAQDAWRGVLEGWLRSGEPFSPELWEAMDGTGGRGLSGLLEASQRPTGAELGEFLDGLGSLSWAGSAGYWEVCVSVVGRAALREQADLAHWQRLSRAAAVPWTPALVEAARDLLRAIDEEAFLRLLGAIEEQDVAAAMAVVRAEGTGGAGDLARASAAVESLARAEEGLPWLLRLAAVATGSDRDRARRLVGRAIGEIAAQRYSVDAADLGRYLDLVADHRPDLLRLEIESSLWSPSSNADTLRALTHSARHPLVLSTLFDRVEVLAASVAQDEAQGFALRREILNLLAARLCDFELDLRALEDAVARLLPEEEDELRLAVATALVSGSSIEPESKALRRRRRLALEAVAGIRSGRERLRARLRVAAGGEDLSDLLTPEALYRAAADGDRVADELSALAVLLAPRRDPNAVAEELAAGMTGPERKLLALADLARHELAFQDRVLRPADRDPLLALLPLRGSLGVVESEERVAALLPELAELGAHLGPDRALAELQEALERVLGLEAVPWTARRQVVELLLRLAPDLLLAEGWEEGQGTFAGARRMARLLAGLAELPERRWPGTTEVRRHWHEVLPAVVALLERLPEPVVALLEHPVAARACAFLAGLAGPSAAARLWHLLQRLIYSAEASTWRREGEGRVPQRWGWLDPEQRAPIRLCLASVVHRQERAQALLRRGEVAPEERRETGALIYLLSRDSPDLALRLLETLPSGPEHDAHCLRLVRCRWLPEALLPSALELASPEVAREGECWLRIEVQPGDEHWLPSLLHLVARSALDPGHPANTPLRRRLWELDREAATRQLARAVGPALRSAGRRGGEQAICWWLNATLAPRMGLPDRQRAKDAAALQAAIEASLELSSDSRGTPAGPESTGARLGAAEVLTAEAGRPSGTAPAGASPETG